LKAISDLATGASVWWLYQIALATRNGQDLWIGGLSKSMITS